MKQQVRIGLLGVGTVGQAVARSLIERQDVLSRAAGTPLILQRAAVRDLARPRSLAVERLTADPAAVASADDVDLVIELVGGEEPARTLIASALERARPVVTANKRVLAWHGPQLAELAARKGVELRYEAAVGGGIPLIAPLTDDLAANRVLELRAIINGTCNYVLTRMASGERLEDALAKAQQAGYAEADPRDDVDAVVADVVHVARRLALGDPVPPPRENGPEPRLLPMAEVQTRCYFRLSVDDEPGVFAQITRVLAEHRIGLASVIQREPGKHGSAEVVLLTYAAPEAALATAEEQLARLSSTRAALARIRVEAPDRKSVV